MVDDDILSGDEGGIEGELPLPPAIGVAPGEPATARCYACGTPASGLYCATCGQKHDDMRRSSFVLGRDFLRDTFGFDSRMWRTLGLMAAKPGTVPKEYAHGRRSRFTPPVRLFLVISFLFFLTIGLTNTLFVGLEIQFKNQDEEKFEDARAKAAEAGVDLSDIDGTLCNFHGDLKFFIKERDLKVDRERMSACFDNLNEQIQERIKNADEITVGTDEGIETEAEQAGEVVNRVFTGMNWAVGNPRAFNNAINDWLPRVMFLMTPVLALILALFLRRKALIYDHLVMSFYTHATGFAVVGLALILGQFGLPQSGVFAFLAMAVYYVMALKRAYGRGWIKTLWTAGWSSFLYISVLMSVVLAIVSRVMWQAAG